MNKRVMAAVAAGVLALLGVLVLYVWAQGANDRAFEGAELVSVVRASDAVPEGTSAADLAGTTEVVELPKEAVPDGAISNLSDVSGQSTNAPLAKGEVLVEARMAAPGDKGQGATDVPPGFQEVAISLESQRVVADQVKAGDKVGVILSYQQAGDGVQVSKMVVQQALVTRSTPALNADAGTGAMVTVAVKTADATKIVNAMEWGKVWLTLQNADTDASGNSLVDPEAAVR